MQGGGVTEDKLEGLVAVVGLEATTEGFSTIRPYFVMSFPFYKDIMTR